MDLKGMLNDGPSGGQDSRKSSEEQNARSSQAAAHRPPPPPPLTTGSQPPIPSSYFPPHAHPLSSASPVRQHPCGQEATPMKPPSQGAGGVSQYTPVPHQIQSPAGAQHYYRSYEPPPGTTPSARPPNQSFFPASGAAQHPGAVNLQARSNYSLSPTPPSNHSPYAPRQSPQSARLPGPGQTLPQHYSQHQHPTTPLTPLRPHSTSRHPSGFQDSQSPYHQRHSSAASNGNAAGSPSQFTPGSVPYSESPAAYNRPSLPHRHSSEYLGRPSRERSESVSPKTKVPPRPPSLGFRQSSVQEMYSRGASDASTLGSTPADSQRHVVIPPQTHYSTGQYHQQQHHYPPSGAHPNLASEVSQRTPMAALATPNSLTSAPTSEASSISQPSRPHIVHHHSSKMGMDRLLTPADEIPPTVNGSPSSEAVNIDTASRPSDPAIPSGAVKIEPRSSHTMQELRQDVQIDQRPSLKTEDSTSERAVVPDQAPATDAKPVLKRSADDSEAAGAPPAKQRRMRKYAQPPMWARLSIHNPKARAEDFQMAAASKSNRPAAKRTTSQQANGVVPEDSKPWTLDPPLDHDLLNARRHLGRWEKSMKWNTPYPDVLRAVIDWLYGQLSQLGDVAQDPREGTVEIEAKFGTIIKDDDRLYLPVMNACVINPADSQKMHLRFESTMTVGEHSFMNKFLNATFADSKREAGRVPMEYEHRYEVDSFHHLSAYGQSLLPQSVQRRQGSHAPRLRVTKDNHPEKSTRGQVLARIVKIPISNLHIYNPGHNYDCRISINLEVNFFNRPDVDLDALIDHEADLRNPPDADRIKDRIAYGHLAYSIDLTKVDRRGMESSHELELEVDSKALRDQIALLRGGQPNAFGDVAAGFLDNATYLMRMRPSQQQQPPPPPQQQQQ